MQEVRIVHTHVHVHVHLRVYETAVLIHAYTRTPALTCASSATTGFSSSATWICFRFSSAALPLASSAALAWSALKFFSVVAPPHDALLVLH
jgi:hypothetical protein